MEVSAAAAELLSSGMQGSSHNHRESRGGPAPLGAAPAWRAAPALPGELAHLQGKAGTAHARGAAAAGGSFT